MGKAGVALGIIAILLGAGGLIFGFVVWNNQTAVQTNIWYQYDKDQFVGTHITYLPIPNMTISFTTGTISSIYMLFTCRASIIPSSGMSYLKFNFRIDGVFQSAPTTQVGTNKGNSTADFYSVTLQKFIEEFPAGAHNVTVILYSVGNSNSVYECTLYIQSFAA